MSETTLATGRGVVLIKRARSPTEAWQSISMSLVSSVCTALLPPAVETLEEQAAPADAIFTGYPDDMSKHVYLPGVRDTNEAEPHHV